MSSLILAGFNVIDESMLTYMHVINCLQYDSGMCLQVPIHIVKLDVTDVEAVQQLPSQLPEGFHEVFENPPNIHVDRF